MYACGIIFLFSKFHSLPEAKRKFFMADEKMGMLLGTYSLGLQNKESFPLGLRR